MTDPDAPDMAQATDPDIAQEPVGAANEEGGGEFPDPDAPPVEPAPGADPDAKAAIAEDRREDARRDPHTPSHFKDVLDAVDPGLAGSGTLPPDDPDRPGASGQG